MMTTTPTALANKRLAVLISGGGSNLKAIHHAIENGLLTDAEIVLVVSDKPTAKGLEWAFTQGLKTALISPALCKEAEVSFEAVLLDALLEHQVDVIVLAGFLRIFKAEVLTAFAGKIVNIHPSLLPAYGGKGMYGAFVHEAVLANQEAHTGCTVHLVTADVDEGEVLGQAKVPVLPNDTVETLAQRVLEQEHRLYAEVLQRWLPTI
ncbi:MAG: phosphoribosylglycinamide formyltransferase [Candidatus Melainabacteria bacterium]|jgi:phosphoribosylglycinamide formyltransferase-1|nr:phosphoribosylglycinamide formyltransferase [Candidatus Melainabacteria bacterium]